MSSGARDGYGKNYLVPEPPQKRTAPKLCPGSHHASCHPAIFPVFGTLHCNILLAVSTLARYSTKSFRTLPDSTPPSRQSKYFLKTKY